MQSAKLLIIPRMVDAVGGGDSWKEGMLTVMTDWLLHKKAMLRFIARLFLANVS